MSSKQAAKPHGTPRIAIVDGAIGGLTLALALRKRGVEANVYEQAPELTEIGAAVALSANSVAIEDEFDVNIPDDDLERFQTVGDFVDYVGRAHGGMSAEASIKQNEDKPRP